jgi:hypothetical protein
MSQQIQSPQGGAVPVIDQPAQIEFPSSSRRRRRSSSQQGQRRKKEAVFFIARGNAQRGRMLVIAMFAIERLFEVAMGFGLPSGADKTQIVAQLIVAALWCSALSLGVLRRQNWCRYILIAFEFLSGTGALAYLFLTLPTGLPESAKTTLVTIYGLYAVIHGGFAWILVRSRDIKRLTSRVQD